MNANGNLSSAAYSELRSGAGVQPKATFDRFKQEAGHQGSSRFAGLQLGNIKTQFTFETSDLQRGKDTPLPYNVSTRTGLYGSGLQPGMGS